MSVLEWLYLGACAGAAIVGALLAIAAACLILWLLMLAVVVPAMAVGDRISRRRAR